MTAGPATRTEVRPVTDTQGHAVQAAVAVGRDEARTQRGDVIAGGTVSVMNLVLSRL